jgi:hypothetical protein
MFRELALLPSSGENPILVGPIEGDNPKPWIFTWRREQSQLQKHSCLVLEYETMDQAQKATFKKENTCGFRTGRSTFPVARAVKESETSFIASRLPWRCVFI